MFMEEGQTFNPISSHRLRIKVTMGAILNSMTQTFGIAIMKTSTIRPSTKIEHRYTDIMFQRWINNRHGIDMDAFETIIQKMVDPTFKNLVNHFTEGLNLRLLTRENSQGNLDFLNLSYVRVKRIDPLWSI